MANNDKYVTIDEIKALLSCNPDTGDLHWRERHGRWGRKPPGTLAGYLDKSRGKGYRKVCIKGKNFYAHRLIWAISHDCWPDAEIDHINGDGADNRLVNLRCASHNENCWNRGLSAANKSGRTGVSASRNGQKWIAEIYINGETKRLGRFATMEEAHDVYRRAAKECRGQFVREAVHG